LGELHLLVKSNHKKATGFVPWIILMFILIVILQILSGFINNHSELLTVLIFIIIIDVIEILLILFACFFQNRSNRYRNKWEEIITSDIAGDRWQSKSADGRTNVSKQDIKKSSSQTNSIKSKILDKSPK
jgi:ABC-type transport system involved in cytochrome bd biosynthesis fused ATPase/permease subunit